MCLWDFLDAWYKKILIATCTIICENSFLRERERERRKTDENIFLIGMKRSEIAQSPDTISRKRNYLRSYPA